MSRVRLAKIIRSSLKYDAQLFRTSHMDPLCEAAYLLYGDIHNERKFLQKVVESDPQKVYLKV